MRWLSRVIRTDRIRGIVLDLAKTASGTRGPNLDRAGSQPDQDGPFQAPTHGAPAPDSVELPLPNVSAEVPQSSDLYLMLGLLGSGSMSEVYLAHHQQWNRDVALKVVHKKLLDEPEDLDQIRRDAIAWMNLSSHPNVACCYNVDLSGELPVLVIEYVDGDSLRDWIADGRLANLSTGLDVAIQLCHAMEHLHRNGVIHRGIRPENVLLTKDGRLKLTDCGIGRRYAGEGPSGHEIAFEGGTPSDKFPAVYEADALGDIFSFGECLYEIFCGRRPYDHTTGPQQQAPEPGVLRGDIVLPNRLSRLMKQCVDRKREARPADSAALREDLCDLYESLNGEPSPYARLPLVPAIDESSRSAAKDLMQELLSNDEQSPLRPAAEQLNGMGGQPDHLAEALGIQIDSSAESIEAMLAGSAIPESPGSLEDLAATLSQEGLASNQATASEMQTSVPEAIRLQELGDHCCAQGKLAEAEALYQQCLAIVDKTLGPMHPYAALSLKELGDLYVVLGEFSKAEPLYQRLLGIQEKVFGLQSPKVAKTLQKLAAVHRTQRGIAP